MALTRSTTNATPHAYTARIKEEEPVETAAETEQHQDEDAMHMLKPGEEEVLRSLQTDRFIKIIIGPDGSIEPFLVSQSMLCRTSEYFVTAIRHELMGNGESRVLCFPEDDLEVWKALLHWIATSKLPEYDERLAEDNIAGFRVVTSCQRPLFKTWSLGDKYVIHDFQDTVMLHLLNHFKLSKIDVHAACEGFQASAPQSHLRRQLAEEIAWALFGARTMTPNDLNALTGCLGQAADLIGAVLRSFNNAQEKGAWDLMGSYKGRFKKSQVWKEFVVGKGPWNR